MAFVIVNVDSFSINLVKVFLNGFGQAHNKVNKSNASFLTIQRVLKFQEQIGLWTTCFEKIRKMTF
jgi:hypothetical protein